MSVITFTHYQPPARYDGLPWTEVRIEESTLAEGPWTELEVIDFEDIGGVDIDPAHPAYRNFTTELGTLDSGWYRVVFVDATGDESLPSEPVEYRATPEAYIYPTVNDLGSLMRARTKTKYNEAGTFTADTRPTAEQAQEIIYMARDLLPVDVTNIPERLYGRAQRVILLLAAHLTELSYWPEQVDNNNQSPAEFYRVLYDQALLGLQNGIQDNDPGTASPRIYSIPVYGQTGRKYNRWAELWTEVEL